MGFISGVYELGRHCHVCVSVCTTRGTVQQLRRLVSTPYLHVVSEILAICHFLKQRCVRFEGVRQSDTLTKERYRQQIVFVFFCQVCCYAASILDTLETSSSCFATFLLKVDKLNLCLSVNQFAFATKDSTALLAFVSSSRFQSSLMIWGNIP